MGQILNKNIISSDNNLETFSLLWLDASVNQSKDNLQTQQDLRATINQLKTFENPNECVNAITCASKEDRIVLIVSGSLGRQIVPAVHQFEQLSSIYIYCQDKDANKKWSDKFTKVRAVVTDFIELIARIRFDQEKRQQSRIYEVLPISIFDPKIVHERLTTDLQGKLVQSQLLINCLLQMKVDKTYRPALIALSKQIYEKNTEELKTIHEFEQTYRPNTAIAWYTKDSFMFRLLNKALRTQNIDLLFLFHFFIVDIRDQLRQHPCQNPIKAYRSQLMSDDELKKLKKSIGEFISINAFFSATTDRDRACSYLTDTNDLQRILFEIDADPRDNTEKPFANIKSFSVNKEDEILFMLGSIFQIVEIKLDQTNICIIKLKFFSDNHQFESTDSDENKLLAFGHVLMTMGKVEEAEIYYRRLLDELDSTNRLDIARCYEALGAVADEKGVYDASLDFYKQALTINETASNSQPVDIASNYNSLGEVYRKKRDYQEASDSFQRALTSLPKISTEKSFAKQAVCYNNMGILYQEQGQYKEALDYYQKAHEIRKKHFREDEISLGMSNNNIGNAYFHLDLYDDAIYYYVEALKIYEKTLPPGHLKIASTYNNIGAIYDDQGKADKALQYYNEAAKIYRNIYPHLHPNVVKIEENIKRVLPKVKK